MSNPLTFENQCRSQEQSEHRVNAQASRNCYEDADMSRPENALANASASSVASAILPQVDFAPERNDEKPLDTTFVRSVLSDRIYDTAKLDGASGLTFDSHRVTRAVETMSPSDARRYSTDARFRSLIDAAVNTLDVPTQRYVAALLDQVAETGERPQEGLQETLLRYGMVNAPIEQTMPVIQSLLAGNPMLRDSLRNSDPASLTRQERALKDTISEMVNTALSAAYGIRGRNEPVNLERTMAENSFWRTGRFSLDMQARLEHRSISFYEQAAKSNRQEIQALVRDGRISTSERGLIKSIAENGGVVTSEHRLRAVSISNWRHIDSRNGVYRAN
ncbi:MAG TPA: hypothetical protein EYN91_23030 [Candidatus Melainabacteria bacterium]|nr:hypothetical protein [Candidatus Melainabacteria bacterium]HIN64594.1 hypothetical protein [Candidatus Obscuribacterales bacterium]